MTRLLRSSFLWQFAGGFLIGTLGMGALATGPEASPPPVPIHAAR